MFIKKLIKSSLIISYFIKIKNFVLFLIQKFFFKKKLLKLQKIKIIIGASGTNYKNWLSTNINLLNLTDENSFKKLLKNYQVNNFLAEHVFEHLTIEEGKIATNNCWKYLKKGGVLRIAVPDGYFPDKEYIDATKPGGSGPGAYDHKVIYNYKTIRNIFDESKFKLNFIEYFDEYQKFHEITLTDINGHILRSRYNDDRNKQNKINYTSLIIDAVKSD